jgi:phosphoglycolate phosphatase-like HAD superfamily hydrolase
MRRAFADLFKIDGVESLSMAGRTDHAILTDLAAQYGVAADAATLARIRDVYLEHLANEIHEPGPRKGVLPGIRSLLDELSARAGVHLALLTGNLEAGARIKLEYFDLWRYFSGGGFGDRAPDRAALFTEAMASLRTQSGATFDPADIVIVGDTPLDVAVAMQTGSRSLAVATGGYDAQALARAGADIVLPDLGDLASVLRALDLAG